MWQAFLIVESDSVNLLPANSLSSDNNCGLMINHDLYPPAIKFRFHSNENVSKISVVDATDVTAIRVVDKSTFVDRQILLVQLSMIILCAYIYS